MSADRFAHATPRAAREEVTSLETVEFKWLEKLEMTDIPINTIMTHWP